MNTTYWIDRIMKLAYRTGTNDVYVGLSSSAPNPDGTGVTEPSGGGYSRAHLLYFSEPSNGEVHNTEPVIFPPSVAQWFSDETPATHWCLFNGKSATAPLLSAGSLDEPMSIRKDVTIRIPIGGISITLVDAQEVT